MNVRGIASKLVYTERTLAINRFLRKHFFLVRFKISCQDRSDLLLSRSIVLSKTLRHPLLILLPIRILILAIVASTSLLELILSARQLVKRKCRLQLLLNNARLPKSPSSGSVEVVAPLVDFQRTLAVQVDHISPLAKETVTGEVEPENVIDGSAGARNIFEDRHSPAIVTFASPGLGWQSELNLLSQAFDVGFGEEAEDSHAGGAGVAIMSAVLSDDEAAVVVDADEVAGAPCFRSIFGGLVLSVGVG
jgi:hypothetical protein